MAPGWLHTAEAQGSAAASDADPSLPGQLAVLWRSMRRGRGIHAVLAITFSILMVIGATASGQIRLNAWNEPFFDALSRRDLPVFWTQLGVFFLIASCLLVLNVLQRWLVEMLKLKLRESLMDELIGAWMRPGRAFWLANAGQIGVNPDQRMHEDARKLCELSADLGTGLIQSSVLFITFAGILWTVSSNFPVVLWGVDFQVPGFLLWAAIAYAVLGSVLSFLAGRSLIARNAERYAHEADLRSSLVWINEHIDGISLAHGERDERRRLTEDLRSVLQAMRRLVSGLTQLTWVTAGFGWITNIAPILCAVPLYFDNRITFGGLMMAAGAFTQAQSSLRWFVDNFSAIADWRATVLRVSRLRLALEDEVPVADFDSRIEFSVAADAALHIDNLQVCYASGCDELRPGSLKLQRGARALIVAEAGTDKPLIFRALAGLWPWGRGHIALPADESLECISRAAPYLPRGSLREALSYPEDAGRFSDDVLCHALRRMGLNRLCANLDDQRRWDRVLGQDEQMALAFARAIVHRPAWLLIDEVLGTLDDEALARVHEALGDELAVTGVIVIGHAELASGGPFSAVWHLTRSRRNPCAPDLERSSP
jgi:putative ATP-binding cassette transporter